MLERKWKQTGKQCCFKERGRHINWVWYTTLRYQIKQSDLTLVSARNRKEQGRTARGPRLQSAGVMPPAAPPPCGGHTLAQHGLWNACRPCNTCCCWPRGSRTGSAGPFLCCIRTLECAWLRSRARLPVLASASLCRCYRALVSLCSAPDWNPTPTHGLCALCPAPQRVSPGSTTSSNMLTTSPRTWTLLKWLKIHYRSIGEGLNLRYTVFQRKD